MEAVLLQSSSQNQQHISPYNRSHVLQNPKRMINNNYSFISRPAFAAENLLPPSNNNIHTGLLQTPPNHLFLSHSSLPPYFPAYGNGCANINHHLSLARGLSWPHPINNRSKPSHNNNRRSSKDSSLNTAKKSKASASANNGPKKEDKSKKPTKVVATKAAEAAASEMVKSLGPDPKDLPKVVSSLSSSSSRNNSITSVGNGSGSSSSRSSVKEEAMEGHQDDGHQMDVFTGSVMFTPSPPPSSLPLPTFSLRPKLSCNAEAAATAAGGGGGAGVDAGATDNLCRLLRLR